MAAHGTQQTALDNVQCQESAETSGSALLSAPVKRLVTAQTASQTVTRLSDQSLLRGIGLNRALHSFGALFKNSVGSGKTYEMSRSVSVLETFLSHNWSTGRFWKFMTLALEFNLVFGTLAMVICMVALLIGIVLSDATNHWTEKEVMTMGVFFFGLWLIFPLFLASAHDFRHLLGLRGQMLFVDKACIHQEDAVLKQAGVESLGAFLVRSRRMLVIYNDLYLKKLWTVYEVATMLTARADAHIVMRPVFLTKLVVWHWVIFTTSTVMTMVAQPLLWHLIGEFAGGFELHVGASVTWVVALVGGWFSFRYWGRKQEEMQEVVDKFDVRSAICFCEADRAFVQANVASFMIANELVRPEASDDEILDTFNGVVKRQVPKVLNACLPPSRVSYKYSLAMSLSVYWFFPWTWTKDILGYAGQGISIHPALHILMEVVWQHVLLFLTIPTVIAVLSVCAKRSLLCGVFGNVGLWLMSAVTSVILPIISERFYFSTTRGSPIGIICFVAFALANLALVLFIYVPKKLQAPPETCAPKPIVEAPAPHDSAIADCCSERNIDSATARVDEESFPVKILAAFDV